MENKAVMVWTYDEVVALLELLTMLPARNTDTVFESLVNVYHQYYQMIVGDNAAPSEKVECALQIP